MCQTACRIVGIHSSRVYRQNSAYTVEASAIKCVDCKGKRIDLITPERFHFVASFTAKWLYQYSNIIVEWVNSYMLEKVY